MLIEFPSVLDAAECAVAVQALARRSAIELAITVTLWRCKMPSIVGTWKLVHATARDAAGTARLSPYGGNALGRVTFTADGRMMSVVCDGRPELPVGASREYSSYCGNYTYDGTRLVTRVDAASDPSRIGSDQVRGVRFEGERMVLIPPARRVGEIEEQREIIWERIAAE